MNNLYYQVKKQRRGRVWRGPRSLTLRNESGQSQKSDRHIRKRTIAEIVAFIQNNLTDYSVYQLCSALKFPRNTYYKVLLCVPSNRRQEYEEFDLQKEGWTHLASVMGLCSRKIIGYAYGTSMTSELAVRAVKNACLNVYDNACIEPFHSVLKKEEEELKKSA